MSRKLILLIAIGYAFTGASVCSAQVEQGAINGTVVDATGAVVPKAKITATNVATQANIASESNEEGFYKIPYLQAGIYTVVVQKEGFTSGRVADIPVRVGQTSTINFNLKTGNVTETITVSANAVLVESSSSSLGYVAGTKQILELPISRNPYALVTLAPGVIAAGNTGTGPIVNGGRSNTSAILFDGQDTRNNSTLDNQYTPPMEVVEEVRFITNSFSAEYGRSAGGVLIAAGKTGTNQLHGSAYEFLRNEALNANSWNNNRLAVPKGISRRHEFGFSLSGPVYIPRVYNGRNKTFFLFNWEGLISNSTTNTNGTMPTDRERLGDFSQTVTATGAPILIYDPTTTVPSGSGFTRSLFPGNVIPANRISPHGTKILEFYPKVNRPGQLIDNYTVSGVTKNPSNKYFVRGDHNFSDRNRMFFRYGGQFSPTTPVPYESIAYPGEPINFNTKTIAYTLALSDTHTFTPSLIGEFRAGYTRRVITQLPRSLGFDITTIGLPQYLKAASLAARFPRISVDNVAAIGPDRASHNIDAENTPQYQAHITWLRGKHAMKFGTDLLFGQFNVFRPDWPSGNFSFARTFTQGPNPLTASATAGHGVATLLLGAPTGGSFTVGPSLAAGQRSTNVYFQDDWKILRNLTLNLGLRWEYQTPWIDRFNNLAYFDQNATDPITGRKGLLVNTTSSNRYPSDPQKKNWAPRVGLAWTFLPNTVFRAGYGIFYAPGSGGIGAAPSDLGSGSQTSTAVFLGQPPAAPNTPPAGASFGNPFVSGLLAFPNSLVGNGISAIFRDWRTPMNQMWNANIQRNITQNLLVEVAYVGSRGMRIWNNYPMNAAHPMFLPLQNDLLTLVDNPFFGKIQGGSLSTPQIRRNQLLVPYPHYGTINWIRGTVGDSVYHGFTVRAERAYSKGLLFQVSYTSAKLIDNVNERFVGGANFTNPYDLNTARSISPNDISQRVVGNFVWELPFGRGHRWLSRGIAGWILGNWQGSGIVTMQTGTPLAISPSCSTQLSGVGCYAQRLGEGALPEGQRTLDKYFNTSAYVNPAPFSLGNGTRTEPNLRNPGQIGFDSVLSRWQPIRERMRAQLRFEMYNMLNHPNLGGPNTSITASNFGQITTKNGNRTMQAAIRLEF